MKDSQASRTAQSMAMFRTLESGRPPKERLFTDEFAAMFLSPSMRLAARLRSHTYIAGCWMAPAPSR
ncbi:MAG: hypothetical protein ABR989_15800 [Candidatus Binatus soli]